MTKKRENLRTWQRAYGLAFCATFILLAIAGCLVDSTSGWIWGSAIASAFGSVVVTAIVGHVVKTRKEELKDLEERYSLERTSLK